MIFSALARSMVAHLTALVHLLIVFVSFPHLASPACFAPSHPFPAPALNVQTSSLTSLFAKINASFQSALQGKHVSWNTSTTSFAVEVTSAEETLWGSYHTAPVLGNYTDSSPTQVTGDTYFRIASITKLFTVLAVLLQQKAGNMSLQDPIVKYIPELLVGQKEGGIQWDQITLESMASQLSGIPRECK